MLTGGGSCHNLLALAEGKVENSPFLRKSNFSKSSRLSQASAATLGATSTSDTDDLDGPPKQKLIIVANQLPLRCKRDDRSECGYTFEWDEDSLVGQAKEGVDSETLAVCYVGTLSAEIELKDQEAVSEDLWQRFGCLPVFLGRALKDKFYHRFCKQHLWPMLHYLLPLSPNSQGRFDAEHWQSYIKANKMFADRLIEVVSVEDDTIWVHDYHLMVLPALMRKRYHKVKCGFFLHSPFPSSEIFRTFPKREEVLRSLLNADVVGFHTFDYARHFLSCCSRLLGLEHKTKRGSIIVEYYGREVSVKILPTGVKPERILSGFTWPDTQWRKGEFDSQWQGKTVILGVDDLDVFKGIEFRLQAFHMLLERQPEYRGQAVLVQVANPARSTSKEITELREFIVGLARQINERFGAPGYRPVELIERALPLHERIALFSVADVVAVTATRDGMNLTPYEYIVCRQGPTAKAEDAATATAASSPSTPANYSDRHRTSVIVVSEFVGCSPSLSGALRVNPWSVDSVFDGLYAALRMPMQERELRHNKHWKYVSTHTASFWAKSYLAELQRVTRNHGTMRSYGLGLGLDTFRMVALDSNFKKLEVVKCLEAFMRSQLRVILLDYDGTLVPYSSLSQTPSPIILGILERLTADERNQVFIVSVRLRSELDQWFGKLPRLGLAAEGGYFVKRPNDPEWLCPSPVGDMNWMELAQPILETYTESTDGSNLEVKESSLVWHHRDADPDFGAWQAKELLDHLEDVLASEPVQVSRGPMCVEIKPQGVSKGRVAEAILRSWPKADFVLCVGDDRSDEQMFNVLRSVRLSPLAEPPREAAPSASLAGALSGMALAKPSPLNPLRKAAPVPDTHAEALPQVYPCTVGQKPSKALFYLNDHSEVVDTLARLADYLGGDGALSHRGSGASLAQFEAQVRSPKGTAPPHQTGTAGVM